MKKEEELIKWVKENFTPDAPLEYILSEYEKIKKLESSVEITRFDVSKLETKEQGHHIRFIAILKDKFDYYNKTHGGNK